MEKITQEIGGRIRAYRCRRGLTQEELAERSELHNTYIGQIERGEKNLSVVSLTKILHALDITFSEFFEAIDMKNKDDSIALQCYEIISQKGETQQKHYLHLLQEVESLIRSHS